MLARGGESLPEGGNPAGEERHPAQAELAGHLGLTERGYPSGEGTRSPFSPSPHSMEGHVAALSLSPIPNTTLPAWPPSPQRPIPRAVP